MQFLSDLGGTGETELAHACKQFAVQVKTRGIVVLLDNRALAKRYGQGFLDAVPKCPQEIV